MPFRTGVLAAAALLWAAGNGAAIARAPLEIEQLEPEKGTLQAEYQGVYGHEAGHALQLSYGVTDHLVLGAEAEGVSGDGPLRFDQAGVLALYRFSDPDDGGWAFGIEGQVDVSAASGFSGGALRGLVEHRAPLWWVQGNLLASREHDDAGWGNSLSYSGSVSRRAGGLWIGVEASGDLAVPGGPDAERGGQYVGPSLILQIDGHHRGLELGTSLLARWHGEGPALVPHCFLQLSF